jgi:hypothetical protein
METTTMARATATETCNVCGGDVEPRSYCRACDTRVKVFNGAMRDEVVAARLHADDRRLVTISCQLEAGTRGPGRRRILAERRALEAAAKASGRWATFAERSLAEWRA